MGVTYPTSHTSGRTGRLFFALLTKTVWLPGCRVSLSQGVFNYLHKDDKLTTEKMKIGKRPFQEQPST